MNRFNVFFLSCVILLSPAIVLAETASLEICNNGRFELDVAVAARIQYIITGYRWKNSGWYAVPARSCAIVYSEDYDEAGPITPQSEALIAYTLVNSDGVWGAYQRDVKGGGGWMRPGTGEICVKQGEAFEFTRPAGDPAAGCDGRKIPVAAEFLPDGPGKFTLTMDWEGDSFFVPLAAGQQASGNTPAKPPEDSVGMQFLKALAKAAAEERQKEDRAAAEAQRQAERAATAPPPPAAPSPPPASSPDPRYVVLCVEPGLIQLYPDSWNMPVIGGKMVTFQNFIGPYILSVAKPNWLYGIGDQAYARFNPAAPSDPASFVSPIPPDQQAAPGKCPSDDSTAWLWRKNNPFGSGAFITPPDQNQ